MRLLIASVFGCAFAQPMSNDNKPPAYKDKAATARWIAHNNIWGSFATTSTLTQMNGEAFANIISYSEGLESNSTGDLYFGVSDMDQSMVDIKSHNFVSLSMSEFQTDYCAKNNWDAEDPRCARLTFSGSFSKVKKDAPEYKSALANLFKTHPSMKTWLQMPSHDFYLAKLTITNIWLIDFFGGAATVPVTAYYAGHDGTL